MPFPFYALPKWKFSVRHTIFFKMPTPNNAKEPHDMLKRLIAATLALPLCSAAALAGALTFTGDADKQAISYAPGEEMTFKIQLLEDGKPVAGKKLKWVRRGDDLKTESGEAASSDSEPLTLKTSIAKPGFVYIMVTACGEDGKPVKDAKNQDIKFEGGAGVEPEKLESHPEPQDFDAFWTKQKEKLAATPMKVLEMKEAPSKNPRVLVYDVKIDCAGGKPVSGYFCKPKDAAPKSIPAQVNFMGYGVSSPYPDMQDGKLTLTINAHGIENGQDAAYYEKLKNNELKGYAFNRKENSDPETAYFDGMMLRVMRALEFIKSQPEWNGKELIVNGGSQGGLQSITAAGLDPAVTKCWAWKPWCCDLAGGAKLGRVPGWRPDWTDALGYFDPVNHAKRIKCEVIMTTGLGDYVCPPSSVSVLYNNVKAPKQITYIQGANHMTDPPNAKKFELKSK